MEWDTFLKKNYPCGRKVCASPLHLGSRWLWIGEFGTQKKHYTGVPQILKAQCKTCERVYMRVYAGMRRWGKPMGALSSRWVLGPGARAMTESERQRHYRAQPGRREEALARDRAYRARRRAELRRTRYVLVAPVGEWLGLWLRETGWSLVDVAGAVGVNEKTLGYWVQGKTKTVELTIVDQVLTGLGRPDLVSRMYPPGTEVNRVGGPRAVGR